MLTLLSGVPYNYHENEIENISNIVKKKEQHIFVSGPCHVTSFAKKALVNSMVAS